MEGNDAESLETLALSTNIFELFEKRIIFAILSDLKLRQLPNTVDSCESVHHPMILLPKGFAGVLKLVDKPDLGSGAYGVWVRLPSPALKKDRRKVCLFSCRIFYFSADKGGGFKVAIVTDIQT